MTVKFTIEPADMRAFSAYNRKHGSNMKRARWIVVVFASALGLNHALAKYDGFWDRLSAFCCFLIVYWAITSILFKLFLQVVVWRSYTKREYPAVICEHTITLTEEALTEVTPVNETRHLWSGIRKVIDAEDHIYLFIAANAAHVIPKRAFLDRESERTFIQQAQGYFAQAHQGV